MIYTLLNCIGNFSNYKNTRKRMMQRLHFLVYDNDCGEKLISKINQHIHESCNPCYWYQLIIWNNFLCGLFNFGAPNESNESNEWRIKVSRIRFGRGQLKQQEQEEINIQDQITNGLNTSIVSLICVDYLIETQLGLKQRNYPLEVKVIEMVKKWILQAREHYLSTITNVSKENMSIVNKLVLQRSYTEAFDILCNILAVFGTHCNVVIAKNSEIIDELIGNQVKPFDAVFNLFDGLKIFEIMANTPKMKKRQESKESEQQLQANETSRAATTDFFVAHFGRYVKDVYEKESKDKLFQLLTHDRWREFISSSTNNDSKKEFYASIATNPNLCYDARFITSIKHIFQEFNDEKMQEWYLQYWDKNGIKSVIDIIYQCGFKFDIFCRLLKRFPKRLQDCRICKFEEWLELIACRNIPDSTKLVICHNPPLRFKDIVNIEDKTKKDKYFEKLKLILVEDDREKAQELFGHFDQRLEMPLIKCRKQPVCNVLLEYLMDDSIPDVSAHKGVYQDKKIVSFFAGNVGQESIQFLHQIVKHDDQLAVKLSVVYMVYLFCVFSFVFLFSLLYECGHL